VSNRDNSRPGGLAVTLAAALLMAACGGPPPPPEPLRPVRSTRVFATSGSRDRTFSGTARAGREINLSFRVPGTVDRLNVRVGEKVRPGQLLASLESRDYEIRVQQAEATLAQARATSRSAGANLERVRGLWEDGNAPQSELDAARAQAESAAAQAEAAEKTLEVARRQLAYSRLVAPVEGAIASVDVEVDENVRQGQTVVVLASGSRPEIAVAMPEVLIAHVREGQPVTVSLDALPGDAFDAVVTEVGVATTGTATTFPVTVRLVRPNGQVRSGMAADVTFRFRENGGEKWIYLPSHAVSEDRDGRFVYVLEPTDEPGVGIVRRTPVEVGNLTADGIEIRDGLTDGVEVVTAGVRRLTDGQKVRLPEPEAGS
jgi:multidrug efflux system membrane fusion protein